jgi:1,5-anhydro-D-fructose reductase (1,5-anhydro-D-mannitol-forming)
MVDKPVGLAVLGYGHFIRTNFIKALRECASLRIEAVYNRGEERRRQAEADGFRATGSLEEALSLPGVEAVLVGTANAAHKEQAIMAARAGKHILCEKPMALNIAEIDEMVAAAEQAGVITHVNHPNPYGEAFSAFRAQVQACAGRVLHFWRQGSRAFGLWSQGAQHWAAAHPEESGGWTFHHACHMLNDACLIVGSNHAVRVYHIGQKSCEEAPSEELVNSLITFDNGATASISDGTAIGPFGDMGVQGTEGDVRLLNNEVITVRPGPVDPTGRPGQRSWLTERMAVKPGGKNLVATGHRFAEAVRGGENQLLSFRYIRDQYRILDAMRQSSVTGKAVDLEWK